MNYKVDLQECLTWIKMSSFTKICIQIPQTLVEHSVKILLYLQEHSNASLFLTSNITFENCCSNQLSAKHVQANALIHFGHACLNCTNILPTFYVFPKQNLDVNIFYQKFYKYFQDEEKEILLFYDVSYAYVIEEIYTKLKIKYKNLIVSTLDCTSNVKFTTSIFHHQQNSILGRCYNIPSDHRIEMYDAIFLGPNNKTLMSLSLSISINQWHYFDDSQFQEYNILNSLWLKRRNFLIEKIKDANIFGIIIASLNMKGILKIIEMLKSVLKQAKKKTYLFNVDKISPTKLANFEKIDIFVAIACPESSFLDSKEYFKPIVTPFEIELAFNNERNFSFQHAIDFKQMLPGGLNFKEFKLNSDADISLISGKLRSVSDIDVRSETNTISEKGAGIISNQISVDNFQLRSWKGLEQKLGENSVNLAVNGRSGLPVNYINEVSY